MIDNNRKFMNKLFSKILFIAFLAGQSQLAAAIGTASSGDFGDTINHWSRYYASNLRQHCDVQGFVNAQIGRAHV